MCSQISLYLKGGMCITCTPGCPHYMSWSQLYLPSLQLAVPSPSPSHVLVPIIPSLPAAGCPLPLPITCAGPYYTFPPCSWLSPPPPHRMCWSLLYLPSLQLAVPSPSPLHVLVPIIPSLPAAGCPRPLPPMDGSIIPFPATNEGAEIVYHCDPGFQPQSNVTAMCASNGSWTPDPAQHQCRGKNISEHS